MATPALHRVQLRTGPIADPASTSLGFFASIGNDIVADYGLDADEQLEFTIPLSDRLATTVRSRQVVRLIFTDASFQEWLIEDVVTQTGDGDTIVRITASSILMLLADATVMEQIDATGHAALAGSYTGTVTQFWDNVILGMLTAAGVTTIGRGTVDPTDVKTFTWSFGDTPLSMVRSAASLTKTEMRIRRNGVSGYLIDWLTRVNGGLAAAVVRARKNLRALVHTESAREQASILYVNGAADSGGEATTLERVGWKVTAVNGGTKRLTLASPLGGAGPISEDGQFSTASVRQYYVLRRKTGRLYQIVASLTSSQEVELPDVSDIAVGEYVELREDNTTALAEHVWGNGRSFLRATTVATNNLTLDNPVTGADALAADADYVDWMARISYEVLSTTLDTAGVQSLFSAGYMRLTSVAGLQVGDWGAILTSGTTPWTLSSSWGIFTITSIDAPNRFIYVSPRYPRQNAWAYSNVNLTTGVRVFRPRALQPRVTASVASTNVATVVSGSGISTNDIVEIIQSTGGRQLSRLLSPLAIAQFGRKVGTMARTEYQGDAVLNDNPVCNTWTGASNVPPDGWAKTVGGTVARVAGSEYGTYAIDMTSTDVATPVARLIGGVGQCRVSVVAVFTIKTGSGWDASSSSNLRMGALLGNTAVGTDPVPLGWGVALYGPGVPTVPEGTRVASEGERVTLSIENLDFEYTQASTYGIKATIQNSAPIILEALLIYAAGRAPVILSEFGLGTQLWQEASAQLAAVAAPETYDINVLDIAAIDSAAYPYSDLEIGRAVRLYDPESNTARSGLRIQQKRVFFFDPEQNRIVVSTKPRTLSEMLSGATITAGKITYGQSVGRR